jgi:hypothetical protein
MNLRVNPKIWKRKCLRIETKKQGAHHFWGPLEGLFNQN